ncbi:cilia- and flagella-associated protein 20-like [Galleria mellonella]|uniref:Cilia- and flagella-associated protein 20-like n=1 Tax=Galleria mellonella TaxID=7137 RepID=A0ABM3MWD7_GALME|nr:cilia- and flagella-associated protein 20-like [Galleria mellonella]
MYRNSYQRGMLTVFFSVGSKPLNIWDTHTQDGYITRFLDQDIKSMVLEIGGTNVSTTYMTCPKGKMVLGITMPFLVMIVKNLKKYFSFEVTILDETGTRRRFRVSNFQSTTQILPLCTVMPIGLSEGWNQIQFNLAEFTRRAYKKQFVEVQKLKINANIRLRRIYFAERLIPEDKLPPEYKLYFPLGNKEAKGKKDSKLDIKDDIKQIPSQQTALKVTEEKKESNADIIISGSKRSVHSVEKISSQETNIRSAEKIETVTDVVEVADHTINLPKEILEQAVENQEIKEKSLEIEGETVQENSEAEAMQEILTDIVTELIVMEPEVGPEAQIEIAE